MSYTKRHRARYKFIDEVDPKQLCCEVRRQGMIKLAGAEMVVEFPIYQRGPATCAACGTDLGKIRSIKVVSCEIGMAYPHILLEGIEIDEVPYDMALEAMEFEDSSPTTLR